MGSHGVAWEHTGGVKSQPNGIFDVDGSLLEFRMLCAAGLILNRLNYYELSQTGGSASRGVDAKGGGEGGGGSASAVTATSGGPSAGDLMTFSPEDQDALVAGMKEVMSSYELEMRHPLRNMLMGQLVRSLLIQVRDSSNYL